MYWLRWHYHIKDIAGAPYKIKKKSKQKRQNCRQSVVTGRQQLYCAVQSRSPNHCQTTTGKVQSSARDGTSSATVHSWQTTAGCLSHVPKPLGRHGHRVLNVWWTVPPLSSLRFHAGQAAIKLPSAEASKRAQCTSPGQYAPFIKGIMKTRVKHQLRKL